MFSQKTKYGLKAVLHLSRKTENEAVLITEISKKEKIPQKFLEAILLELKKSGVLNSKKGKGGGYFLSRNPRYITIGEVIRSLEGPVGPFSFQSPDEIISEKNPEIKIVMEEVRNAMSKVLDKTSILDLIEKSQNSQNIANFVI